MNKIFGKKKIRLYDGSMNEWAANDKNPLVKGKLDYTHDPAKRK